MYFTEQGTDPALRVCHFDRGMITVMDQTHIKQYPPRVVTHCWHKHGSKNIFYFLSHSQSC